MNNKNVRDALSYFLFEVSSKYNDTPIAGSESKLSSNFTSDERGQEIKNRVIELLGGPKQHEEFRKLNAIDINQLKSEICGSDGRNVSLFSIDLPTSLKNYGIL